MEYTSSQGYEAYGQAKVGEDFFAVTAAQSVHSVMPEDLSHFQTAFTEADVKRIIREKGDFTLKYRLLIHGKPRPIRLRAAMIKDQEAIRDHCRHQLSGRRDEAVRMKT